MIRVKKKYKKRINKSNIKRYASIGLLISMLITGIGLEMEDAHVDYTQKICSITQILNVIQNLSYFQFGTYLPSGAALHQCSEMERDYYEKGIEDVQILYGKIIERKINGIEEEK